MIGMSDFANQVLLGGRKAERSLLTKLDRACADAWTDIRDFEFGPPVVRFFRGGGSEDRDEPPPILMQALLSHADVTDAERIAMVTNLLKWASAAPLPPELAYQRGGAFVAAHGVDLGASAAALVRADPYADPQEAASNFSLALRSATLDEEARLYLFLAYPGALERIHTTKRASALRAIAETFFSADNVSQESRDHAEAWIRPERTVRRRAWDAPEPDAWQEGDLDDPWWTPDPPPPLAQVLRHLAATVAQRSYGPYREGLACVRGTRGDLALELAHAETPREAVALVNLARQAWRPELEPAVVHAARSGEPLVRQAALEALLVHGEDLEKWGRRCLSDRAASIRSLPAQVAISRQKHVDIPDERRRALLLFVRRRRRRFALAPRQEAAFEKLCADFGVTSARGEGG
ncbi:MAG: hypothetical protein ACYDDF_03395 [Thermoplasmatota archaeon]